jgi:HK97 family phage major capsid protein
MQAAPLSTATASNDDIMLIADWSNYLVLDRLGSTVHFSDWVLGSSRRPTGEAGWMFFTRVGGGVLNNDAFRLQRV